MGRPDYNRQTIISAITAESIEYASQNVSTPLAAGQTETINFFAPVGCVGSVNGCHVSGIVAPVGAASGTQELYMMAQGVSVQMCKGVATYSEAPAFANGEFLACTTSKSPALTSPGVLLKGVCFDSDTSFSYLYKNLTNVEQTATRSYRLSYSSKKVA